MLTLIVVRPSETKAVLLRYTHITLTLTLKITLHRPNETKAVLLRYIAADQLPAFLGGDFTLPWEEDGAGGGGRREGREGRDPQCTAWIVPGGTVPRGYTNDNVLNNASGVSNGTNGELAKTTEAKTKERQEERTKERTKERREERWEERWEERRRRGGGEAGGEMEERRRRDGESCITRVSFALLLI